MDAITPIDTIVVNFGRPKNIPVIISAMRRQTVPVRIFLVDVGGGLSQEVMDSADVYMRARENDGGYNRFLPLWQIRSQYVWWHDDDVLPGRRAMEHCLATAATLEDFSVLGQRGRIYRRAHWNANDIPQQDKPVPVDAIVCSYFFNAKYLPQLLELRKQVTGPRGCDLLMSCGIKALTGAQAFLVPTAEADRSMTLRDMTGWDTPGLALSSTTGHRKQRHRMLGQLQDFGWKPLAP